MRKRPEDLTDDELRILCGDLADHTEALDDDSNGAPDDLLEQWHNTSREQSRSNALAARKAGRFSATFDVEGEEVEYKLKATTLEDAEAEAESGAQAMNRVSGQPITVARLNGPIGKGK